MQIKHMRPRMLLNTAATVISSLPSLLTRAQWAKIVPQRRFFSCQPPIAVQHKPTWTTSSAICDELPPITPQARLARQTNKCGSKNPLRSKYFSYILNILKNLLHDIIFNVHDLLPIHVLVSIPWSPVLTLELRTNPCLLNFQ